MFTKHTNYINIKHYAYKEEAEGRCVGILYLVSEQEITLYKMAPANLPIQLTSISTDRRTVEFGSKKTKRCFSLKYHEIILYVYHGYRVILRTRLIANPKRPIFIVM